jgi:DNA-binding GntR family transcriptional regulator
MAYNPLIVNIIQISSEGDLVAGSGQLAPLRLESTPVLVADRLREGILDGTFPPRTQLSEVALSQQLSVSRGPIREAMQRLLQEGLLRGERNRGVFVVDLGPSDVRDIYLARSAVERAAAAIVTSGGNDEDFDVLQSMVDQLAAAVDSNWVELTKLDLQFHLALVAAAASPRLDRMFRTLVAESQLCIARLEPFYPGRDEVVREHQEILDAIRASDLAEVDRLMAAHMDISAARLASADESAQNRPE